jgi:hypothetical protein
MELDPTDLLLLQQIEILTGSMTQPDRSLAEAIDTLTLYGNVRLRFSGGQVVVLPQDRKD